jgi:hypothetical protein
MQIYHLNIFCYRKIHNTTASSEYDGRTLYNIFRKRSRRIHLLQSEVAAQTDGETIIT